MPRVTDVNSLTDFQRRTKEHIGYLKDSGSPMILTVNGKAEIVVQDAASYQELLDLVERAEAIVGIRRGLDSIARGEGIPLEEVELQMREKYDLPR